MVWKEREGKRRLRPQHGRRVYPLDDPRRQQQERHDDPAFQWAQRNDVSRSAPIRSEEAISEGKERAAALLRNADRSRKVVSLRKGRRDRGSELAAIDAFLAKRRAVSV